MTSQSKSVKQGSAHGSISDIDIAALEERTGQPVTTEQQLPLDVLFDLLANERRRRVVRYLLTESETTTLGDLAEHIAAIENDKPEAALSSTERKRVYISLYQCHLPKMDDANVVEFDENRKTVEIGPNLPQVTSYLPAEEEIEREDEDFSMIPLAITAVVGVLFVVQQLLFSNAWLSGLLIGFLVVSTGTIAMQRVRKEDEPEKQ